MTRLSLNTLLVLAPVLASFFGSSAGQAAQIRFSFDSTCNPVVSTCPTAARMLSFVITDTIRIDTLTSDVPGFTTPTPISSGLLTFATPPLSLLGICIPSSGSCAYSSGNIGGGNISITGSVFGLAVDSQLLSGSFEPGTSAFTVSSTGSVSVNGPIKVNFVAPELLLNLGLGQWPNSGQGILSDFYSGTFNNMFPVTYQASVTFTPVPEPNSFGILACIAVLFVAWRRFA